MSVSAFVLALIALSWPVPAQAHESGHGPALSGSGPNGGKLVAVVTAKEADLGRKAKAVAYVEWKRKGNTISVNLLSLDRSPLKGKNSGDAKWILLRSPKEKAEVILSGVSKAATLVKEFPSLKGVETAEIIFPAGFLHEEKTVAAFGGL